ncbi:MAG: M15 family metallopeptidase [Cyanobacteria bacterium]|nr:M15 family metallopeptidase [Cyanobacteriota bacterium]
MSLFLGAILLQSQLSCDALPTITKENTSPETTLPTGFVYLDTIDPTILQDLRYATSQNFMGRQVQGYDFNRCILTEQAAQALHRAQEDLKQFNLRIWRGKNASSPLETYSLKVYDCYRPQQAVDDFIAWSKIPSSSLENSPFHSWFMPRVLKQDLFKLGYVAEKSSHTRGSTVDITLVKIPSEKKNTPQSSTKPLAKISEISDCGDPLSPVFLDDSVEMGTRFDCFDPKSHTRSRKISRMAKKNRRFLVKLMTNQGFINIPQEWWHFTFQPEPFPNHYFNFPVR